MIFSLFGLIYILVIAYFIIKGTNCFFNILLLSAVADLFFDMGFVFSISGKALDYCELPRHVMFLYCILQLFKGNMVISKVWVALVICCVLPIALLYFFPSDVSVANYLVSWDEILMDGETPIHPVVDGYVLSQTRVFITSSMILLYAYQSFTIDDYMKFILKLRHFVDIFLVLGFIEFIAKNILGLNSAWGNLMKFLWGENDALYESEMNRGSFYDLNLFTREPSHWAYSLFVCAVIIFATDIIVGRRSGYSKSMLLCMVLMALSLSFSSVLFLASFILLWIIYRWYLLKPKTVSLEKKLVMMFLGVVFMLGASFLLLFPDNLFASRLLFIFDNFGLLFSADDNLLFLGADNGSNFSVVIRLFSIVKTLLVSFYRPLCGFSLGAMTCHGSTILLLSGIGVMGLYVWTYFVFYTIPLKMYARPVSRLFACSIIIYLGVNIFNSLALRPFYDLTLFIIVVSFLFIFQCKKTYSYL